MDLREEELKRDKSIKEEGEKKRRFQIVKLEERIAPIRRNTHKGCSSNSGSSNSTSFSGY